MSQLSFHRHTWYVGRQICIHNIIYIYIYQLDHSVCRERRATSKVYQSKPQPQTLWKTLAALSRKHGTLSPRPAHHHLWPRPSSMWRAERLNPTTVGSAFPIFSHQKETTFILMELGDSWKGRPVNRQCAQATNLHKAFISTVAVLHLLHLHGLLRSFLAEPQCGCHEASLRVDVS